MLRSLKEILRNATPGQIGLVAVLLSIPAFLIHLGLNAFIGDEAIRTLVAFEMKHSGNFIVPTLNGEFYFNKPPLYNWMIYGMSSLFGYYGEWPTRLTTILCLAGFAWIVYHFVARHMDRMAGWCVMLMTLTCGRILFWDSMLGLIDICFSAVIYLNMMILYHYGQAGKWKNMFLFSYLLFSAAFLLKGLPALVFQAISILTALLLFNKLKSKFFSRAHILCALIGILPAALYYYLYARSVSLEHVFSILTDQSLQRTATHHGIVKTLIHLFTFPFAQIYHFLPWSLLLITFFHPQFRTWLKENEFTRFNFWMFMTNIPVYWLSVQVYPRYLLMFVPLFSLTAFYIYRRWKPGGGKLILWMSVILLMIRIVFDLVVLPIRSKTFQENITRTDAKRVAKKYPGQQWVIYGNTETHQVARFYMAVFTDQINRKTPVGTFSSNTLYLVDEKLYPDFPMTRVDSIRLERGEILGLYEVTEPPSE